jgi:hypothetical protein
LTADASLGDLAEDVRVPSLALFDIECRSVADHNPENRECVRHGQVCAEVAVPAMDRPYMTPSVARALTEYSV